MLEDIRPLVDEGFAVHLLRPRSKAPVADGWSKAPVLSWTDLKRRYQGDNNVGVRLGKPSRVDGRYLHVIDLDIRVAEEADDAWDRLKRLLPGVRLNRLPCVQSGSRGESRHLYFVTADPFPSRQIANSGKKFTDSAGKQHWTWEIEVFGTGKQVALPPSIHPDTGKTYRWLNEPDFEIGIPEISPDLIADLVYGGQDEGEGEADTEILGLTYAEAEGYLADLDLDYWCDDREGWRNVGMALHHEFNGSKDAFRLWVEFSKRSRKFELDVCRQQWKSFHANTAKPIRMATIVQAAQKGRLASAVDDLDDEATVAKQAQDAARAPARGRRGDPNEHPPAGAHRASCLPIGHLRQAPRPGGRQPRPERRSAGGFRRRRHPLRRLRGHRQLRACRGEARIPTDADPMGADHRAALGQEVTSPADCDLDPEQDRIPL